MIFVKDTMVSKLVESKVIKVLTMWGVQEMLYELSDKGTFFAMRRVNVDGVYNPGDVHVGTEQYVRTRWSKLTSNVK